MNRLHAKAQGIADAETARNELYGTLAQLKERMNYAKRFDRATARAQARVQIVREERPLVFLTGVVAVAAVAGTVVWAVANRVARSTK